MSVCLLYSPILSTSSPGERHSIVEFIGQEIHGVLDVWDIYWVQI